MIHFGLDRLADSNDKLPEPMMIDARNSIVRTPDSRKIRPTS
jgi:hypothetical protein